MNAAGLPPQSRSQSASSSWRAAGARARLMRAHDWSESPLGAPESWPQPLRTVVGLLLQSRFPMFVAWGDALGFLYNDPYAEILGAKHPRALGRRFHDIWSEIWPDISPLIDAAMAGQAIYREDLPLVMNRKGYDEQTWFTFSYSPVRDESGKIAGMFCACSETTRRVLAERGTARAERDARAPGERGARANASSWPTSWKARTPSSRWLISSTGGLPSTGRRRTSSNASSASALRSAKAWCTCWLRSPSTRRRSRPYGAARWAARSSWRLGSSVIRRGIAGSTRCATTLCAMATACASARTSSCMT